jgi:hypothetical protein
MSILKKGLNDELNIDAVRIALSRTAIRAAEVAGGARGDQCVDTPSITGVGTSSERAALAGVICCACGGTVSIAELIGVEYAIAAEL